MKFREAAFSFLLGFFLYGLVEIAGRGYTHWTMCLTGGAAMTALYAIDLRDIPLAPRCALGALAVTAIELVVGIFDNIIMRWAVWDYSELPFNFLGQICLFFSLYWFALCFPAFFVCGGIRRRLGAR